MPEFFDLADYYRGWVVGNFSPSIERIDSCEVSVIHHTKQEESQAHYHTSSREINIVVLGKVRVNNVTLEENGIFVYNAFEVSEVEFLEDSILCVIRVPSTPTDKVIVT
jgi:hypothetical protein